MKVEERLLKYVSYDTTSDPYSENTPSNNNVLELAKYLVNELKDLGIDNAYLDEYGRVYASIKGNTDKGDKIGFIAHMDTSCDACGKDIKPQIIKNYDGKDIILNKDKNIILSPKEFAHLNEVIGDDIITTDGTTLLGADDKAGIAIIMNMAEYFINNPEIKHNDIKIAFTPDEEIGRGADHFNFKGFDADYAFTMDGGSVNELCYENFNAYAVDVDIHGISMHPGDSKGKMVNSILIANEFESLLPEKMKPMYTELREGFNHLHTIKGSCEFTKMEYIVRNHDYDEIQTQLKRFEEIKDELNKKYGNNTIEISIKEQYLNMYQIIKDHMNIVEKADRAMRKEGVIPDIVAMRGGTDGARLTFEGLITPNLGTGGFNYHGNYEFVSINMMNKAVEILKNIICENL